MANYEIITKITDELTLLHEEQDALMTEWEELQLKLEDAENEE